MEYLKEEKYYQDLYDLFTIQECLDFEQGILNRKLTKKDRGKLSAKRAVVVKSGMAEFGLYFVKGERYKNKADRIRGWKEADQKRQDKFDSTPEPRGIYCPNDSSVMQVVDKHLDGLTNRPLRVLFFFECPSCKKRRGVYDTGEELVSKPRLCPKCSSELKTTYKKSGKILTTTEKCTSCTYVQSEVDDYEKSHIEWEKKQAADRDLLDKYRDKYCLSDSEGFKYVSQTEGMKRVVESLQETERKQADPAYQKALQLKKLTVVEVEKLLNETLEKEKYVKFTLDKPEMGRFVVIPFTTQDAQAERKEYDSTNQLKKLIRKTLEDTNWRLMVDGTYYRLGYVYGRIKGYEKEDDMMELFKKRKEEKKLTDETGGDYIY